jgi:hypothetical protein
VFFGFSERKRAPVVDRRRSLDAVPVRNAGVEAAASDGADAVVTVPIARGSGFLARFQPPVMRRTVQLDEIGSFVFGLVDGRRTTREIVDAFVHRYRVNRREAELSCVEFLKSLVRRQAISIVVR